VVKVDINSSTHSQKPRTSRANRWDSLRLAGAASSPAQRRRIDGGWWGTI